MEASGARAEAGSGLTGSNELARNALGLPQILFCIVTGSAPLAASGRVGLDETRLRLDGQRVTHNRQARHPFSITSLRRADL